MSNSSKRIMLVAGEASGDLHAAELVKAIHALHPEIVFYGVGGKAMRAAGVDITLDCSELAVMGFVDVLLHLRSLRSIFKMLEQSLKDNPPDLLITVDYPGFNLRLAKVAKRLGIKVLHYISPQVWAWRPKRVHKIAEAIDHLAVIFPFEIECYKDTPLTVTYVGHPLTYTVAAKMTKEEARQAFSIKPGHKVIGLMPGSRKKEIEGILPIMVDAAHLLQLRMPNIQFLLPVASTLDKPYISQFINHEKLNIQFVENDTYNAMQACDAMMITSGTATLEAALMRIPLVVIYKTTRFTAWLMRRLLKLPYVSLCNIIAGKAIVPELLQENATKEKICLATLRLLQEERYRNVMIHNFDLIKEKLGKKDAPKNTAIIAARLLGYSDETTDLS